jgi:hypothetical protein
LAQAARSAAEADGVAPPSDDDRHDSKVSTEDLLSRLSGNENMTQESALAAMERARAAVNAASAGSAAHLLAANPVRKAPVPGPTPGSSGGGKKKGPPLRRGKWTPEEESYANRLIQEFKAGLLPLTDGTTLRTFLSKLLNCDPMRISKKFVGSNCIGKQVFRRRTADINRLTAEQIQQSRAELSDLERRFLERVAQTNRVKSSGVGGGTGNTAGSNPNEKAKDELDNNPQSPPWLNPPVGYKHGQGASMASANLSGGASNRSAAAAGRALLHGLGSSDFNDAFGQHAFGQKQSHPSLSSRGSAGLMALAGLGGDSTSRQNLLNALSSRGSASSLFAAAAASNSGSGLSGSAMAQIARNASAARLAGLTAAGSSMNNLLLKSGLSRDQLSQLARDGGVSSASLSNMIDRQSSFDALMSLDLQSLQSIDNLANLIQSGGSLPGQNPQNGLKNWSAGDSVNNLAHAAADGSGGNLSDLASARRLASVGRMQSLLRSLSSQNMQKNSSGGGSNANFSNLLQSMQNNLNNGGNSANSLFGNNNQNNNYNSVSALSLANLLRDNSSTGLSALRQQEGINQRNTSVDDFLSLVAAGDIPHQDPSLLNISLMHQQQQQGNNQSGAQAAATLLAHQQLLAQVGGSNSALASALARSGSFNHLQNNASAASLYGGGGGSAASLFNSASARAALSNLNSSSALKRKLMDLDNHFDQQGNHKR